MHVDQRLERPLSAAGNQPVDGTPLVRLQMVLEKVDGQVAADGIRGRFALALADGFRDESQVLVEGGRGGERGQGSGFSCAGGERVQGSGFSFS